MGSTDKIDILMDKILREKKLKNLIDNSKYVIVLGINEDGLSGVYSDLAPLATTAFLLMAHREVKERAEREGLEVVG